MAVGRVNAIFDLSTKGAAQNLKKISSQLKAVNSSIAGLGKNTDGLNKFGKDTDKASKSTEKLGKESDKLTKSQKTMNTVFKEYSGITKANTRYSNQFVSQNRAGFQKLNDTTKTFLRNYSQMETAAKKAGVSASDFNKVIRSQIASNQALRKDLAIKGKNLIFTEDIFNADKLKKNFTKYKGVLDQSIRSMDTTSIAKMKGMMNSLFGATTNTGALKQLEHLKKQNLITGQTYATMRNTLSAGYVKEAQSLNLVQTRLRAYNGQLNQVSRSQRMQNYAMQVSAMRYNALGLAVGAFSGMLLGQLSYGFIYARANNIRMDQQMQQFLKTMKLSKAELKSFNDALDDYVAKFPKVSKYNIGNTVAQIGKLNNLTMKDMNRMIPIIADVTNMMQLNGRTAEDAMLAVNDAFEGQFKRLQEIGVMGRKHLEQHGWDGSAQSLVKALESIGKEKGWSDLTKDVSTAADAMMILGNAIDRVLVPTINLLTPAIVAISVAIADFITWIGEGNTALKVLASVIMLAGGAFAYMKLQMGWAALMGSDFMAKITGINSGMSAMNTATSGAAVSVANLTAMGKGLPIDQFDELAMGMAEINYEAKNGVGSFQLLKNSNKEATDALSVYGSRVDDVNKKMTNQVDINQQNIMKRHLATQAVYKEVTANGILAATNTELGRVDRMRLGNYARMNGMSKAQAAAKIQEIAASKGLTIQQALETQSAKYSIVAKIRSAIASRGKALGDNVSTAAIIKNMIATKLKTGAENTSIATTIRSGIVSTISAIKDKALAAARLIQAGATATATAATTALTTAMYSNIYLLAGAIVILTALAVVYQTVGKATMKAVAAQEKYRNFLDNGEETIENLTAASEKWRKKEEELIKQRDKYAPNTKEWIKLNEDVKKAHEMTAQAADEAKYAEEQLKRGREQEKVIKGNQELLEVQQYNKQLEFEYRHGIITEEQYQDQKGAMIDKGLQRIQDGFDRRNRIIGIGQKVQEDMERRAGQGDPLAAFSLADPKYLKERAAGVDELADAVGRMNDPDTGSFERFGAWLETGLIRFKLWWMDTAMWIGSIKKQFHDWVRAVDDGVNKYFGNIGNLVMSGITSIIDGFTWLSDMLSKGVEFDLGKWVMDGFTNMVKIITDAVAWVTPTIDALRETLKGIVCIIVGCSPGIIPALQEMYNWFVIIWTGISTTILPIINTITSGIMNFVNSFLTGMFNLWNWFSTTFTGGLSFVSGKISWFVGVAGGYWNLFTSRTNNAFNKIKEIIRSITAPINNLLSTFKSMVSGFISSAQRMSDQVKAKIQPLIDKLKWFVGFLKNPLGGGGSVGTSARAGTAGLTAGIPGAGRTASYTSTKGLSANRNRSNTNIFAGLGSAIKSTVTNVVKSTQLGLDPRNDLPAGTAGAGGLNRHERKFLGGRSINRESIIKSIPGLILDPRECTDKKTCFAGYDPFGHWVGMIYKIFSNLDANFGGVALNMQDIINGKGNLAVFEMVARKLIGATRYQFYYGDGKSNAQALADGSFNCYDGAQILVALAQGMGLSAHIASGYWNNTPHSWANVGGKAFDTTAFQKGQGWTSPSVRGYGSPNGSNNRNPNNNNNKFEININVGTVNGISDWEKVMGNVAEKVVSKKFGFDTTIGL